LKNARADWLIVLPVNLGALTAGDQTYVSTLTPEKKMVEKG
jgi:hypothetical protein